jgi:caffeoyl-CoA O-methyltransferase
MDFIDEAISSYAENHSGKEPEVLQELSRETQARILYPRMLSGHLQGRFLAAVSRMLQPESILEIGTYTGYSAICLAEGLKPGGKLLTLDANDELRDIAMRYFEKSGYAHCIELINGDAMKLLPEIKSTFDLVFIDADKINYSNYFDLIIDRVKKGGWILADNVLWSGNVLLEENVQDPETKAIHAFNIMVRDNPKLFKVLLPLRDGLLLIQKQ